MSWFASNEFFISLMPTHRAGLSEKDATWSALSPSVSTGIHVAKVSGILLQACVSLPLNQALHSIDVASLTMC